MPKDLLTNNKANEEILEKIAPKWGGMESKPVRKNISYPPKAFLSNTLYSELPKNLVICFKGTLASFLQDTTKTFHGCLHLLNLEQRISP